MVLCNFKAQSKGKFAKGRETTISIYVHVISPRSDDICESNSCQVANTNLFCIS